MKSISAGICIILSIFLFPPDSNADEFSELMNGLGNLSSISSLSSLEEFISKHPKHAIARYQLARAYLSARLPTQAEDQLRACMELTTAGSELHNNCIAGLKEISESKYAQAGAPASLRPPAPSSASSGGDVFSSSSMKGGIRNFGNLKTPKLNKSGLSHTETAKTSPAISNKKELNLQTVEKAKH